MVFFLIVTSGVFWRINVVSYCRCKSVNIKILTIIIIFKKVNFKNFRNFPTSFITYKLRGC